MNLLDDVLLSLPDSFWKESLQSRISWKIKILSYTNHAVKRRLLLKEIKDLTKMMEE